MLLAGDIGGTKTNLALFASQDRLRTPRKEATFVSAQYSSLEELVKTFLLQERAQVDQACFGVAGPVVDGKANITNLPWKVEVERLKQALDIPVVSVINDLLAMAYAIPYLEKVDVYPLSQAQPEPGGVIAVIAPGTGLGEAFLTWEGVQRAYLPHSSEGGHTDFGPTNQDQIGLLSYMLQLYEHVSYEHVCSGIGIPNLYKYYRDVVHLEEPEAVSQEILQAHDATPAIVDNAKKGLSRRCVATMEMFASILGAEAGNLALKTLATGGIYLGGGIPKRILQFLESDIFMNAFRHKGRLSKIVMEMPLYIITNPNVALWGAAAYGFKVSGS